MKDSQNRWRLFRFTAVGLSGVGVNIGMLYLLAEHSTLPFYFCSLLAIETSIITNFILNDRWTWADKREGAWIGRLFKYNLSTAFTSIFLNLLILLFLKEWFGAPYLLANLIGIGVGMGANFILNHLWTYGSFRFTLPKPVWQIGLISLFARIFLAATLGAGFDEAYYFSYSIRPAMSYFDHPPVVGFIAGLFPFLLGIVSPLTIRLGAICLFTISGLLLYKLAKSLLPPKEAIWAYLFFNLVPIFPFGAGMMILPDAGLAFFWVLTLLVFKQIMIDKKDGVIFWIAAGICTGLAMLSKYHGVLLGFSLILYLIFYRPKAFLTFKPYLYGLTAFLVFSPVLIWNLRHDWISFRFQGNRAMGGGIRLDYFLQALGGQAAYLALFFFVLFVIIIVLTFKKGLFGKDPLYHFFFFYGTIPVLIFNGIALFQPILPHWTLPGYILLTLPLGTWTVQNYSKTWVKQGIRIAAAVFILLLGIAYLHTQYGILHFEKWHDRGWMSARDVRMDGTLDTIGWDRIKSYLEQEKLTPDQVFLFTHRWFLSGEVELATDGKYKTLCFHERDPRGFGIWDSNETVTGMDGLFICTNRNFRNPVKSYGDYFESISAPDTLTIRRGGVIAKQIYVYRCKNLLKSYPNPYSSLQKKSSLSIQLDIECPQKHDSILYP